MKRAIAVALLLSFVATSRAQNPFLQQSAPATAADMEKILPPRELRLALKHAKQAQEDGDLARLSVALGTLMEGIARTDYLVDDASIKKADQPKENAPPPQPQAVDPNAPPRRVPLLSMRRQVETLIDSLSAEERDAFQTLHGVKANQAIDKALSGMDANAIERAAHRWRYTDGGQDGAMLVARMRIDRGRYSEAIGLLYDLRRFRQARERFEPELSQLLISATWRRGQYRAAEEMVRTIAREEEWVANRMEGSWRRILSAASNPEAKLESRLQAELGKATKPDFERKVAWPVFMGAAERRQEADLPELLNEVAWRRDIASNKTLSDRFATQTNSQVTAGAQILPVTSPTLVNQQMVVRTPERIVSMDAATGEDLWSYPFDYASSPPFSEGGVNAIQIQVFRAGGVVRPQSEAFSKLWHNRTYGQLAANSKFVFAIDGGFDLPTSRQQQIMMMGARGMGRLPGRFNNETLPKVHNRLVAIDLERQGAVAWVVGGKTGEMNNDLAGVFFLGPPVPDFDRLYVLVEKAGVVQLVALDAQTGATEWKLNIAPTMTGVDSSLLRRMLGASPSLKDGLLVCPTTVGGLVAIDVIRRQFVWGWAPEQTTGANALQRRMMQVTMANGGWLDKPVLMTKDRVIHATDPNYVYCLDRESGKVQWRRARQDAWFVACASNDVVLLVGRHRYTGVKIADGKPAWTSPFRAIPAGGVPTGRGLVDKHSYLLPTSEGSPGESPELLRIDLRSGDAERVPLKHRLGNLATDGVAVAAAGPDGLSWLAKKPEAPEDAEGQDAAAEAVVADKLDWKELAPGQLVDFLADDAFAKRQQATNELLRRKAEAAEAIPALGDLALGDDPEAAQRAGIVLTAIRDADVEDPQLIQILEQAKQARNGLSVILPNASKRRKRAIARMMSLGATVQRDGEYVFITRWRGKPEDFAALQEIKEVKHLMMYNESRIDQMISYISGLPNLQVLSLQNCRLSDEGLAKLKELPKLRQLELRNTRISDKSVGEFKRFPALRILGVLNTQITKEGGKKLKEALPRATVNVVQ